MKKTAILSILLCLCMVCSLVLPCVNAYASSSSELAPGGANDTFPGGNTSDDLGGNTSGDLGGNTSGDLGGNTSGDLGGNTSGDLGGSTDTPAGGTDTPAGDTLEIVIGDKKWTAPAGKWAYNTEVTTPGDYQMIVLDKKYTGAAPVTAWGVALVIKDGKLDRAYDGISPGYWTAAKGGKEDTCHFTNNNYASVALSEVKDGETLIIFPNGGDNAHRAWAVSVRPSVGKDATLTGLPKAEEPATSGSISVTTTDTFGFHDMYTFTAPADGTYTFVVPAGLGFYSKAKFDVFAPAEVDFGGDKEATVSIDLLANETYSFYVGATEKGDWTITWSFAITSGTIEVTTTDPNGWVDLYSFTANVAGVYEFTVPAGLSVWEKDGCENYTSQPYIDFNTNPQGGTFLVELAAGQTLSFYVSAAIKGDWIIGWAISDKEPVDSSKLDGVWSAINMGSEMFILTFDNGKLTITDVGMVGPFSMAGEYTYTMDPTGMPIVNTDKFTIIKDMGGNLGMQIAGIPMPLEMKKTAELSKNDTTLEVGENTVIITDGMAGADYTFVVEAAGNYTFQSNDLRVQIFNEMGMMVGMGMQYLEPGTYTISCYAMGATGEFKLTIITDANEEPKMDSLVMGDNTVVFEEGVNSIDFLFEVTEAGMYVFSSNDVLCIIKTAEGVKIENYMTNLEPGTYIITVANTGEVAGTYTVNVSIDNGDQEAADAVIEMIGDIGEVTKDSKSAIKAARVAYNQLTDAQKALVTNLDVLTAAEEALAALETPSQPEPTTPDTKPEPTTPATQPNSNGGNDNSGSPVVIIVIVVVVLVAVVAAVVILKKKKA